MSRPETSRRITDAGAPDLIRALATEADVDVRSVAKALRGGRVRGKAGDRLAHAMVARGVAPEVDTRTNAERDRVALERQLHAELRDLLGEVERRRERLAELAEQRQQAAGDG